MVHDTQSVQHAQSKSKELNTFTITSWRKPNASILLNTAMALWLCGDIYIYIYTNNIYIYIYIYIIYIYLLSHFLMCSFLYQFDNLKHILFSANILQPFRFGSLFCASYRNGYIVFFIENKMCFKFLYRYIYMHICIYIHIYVQLV